MSDNQSYKAGTRYVVGVFHALEPFGAALNALQARGFDRSHLSVLAEHGVVRDHFDGEIPPPEVLADSADTPREGLDVEAAVHAAARFIAEAVSALGTLAAAGVAYAVGGPVGIAAAASDAAEFTADGLLSRHVDATYRRRYEQSLRDGGIVCWVSVRDKAETIAAWKALNAHGGEHVHEVEVDALA